MNSPYQSSHSQINNNTNIFIFMQRSPVRLLRVFQISGANPSAICDSIIFNFFVCLTIFYYFNFHTGLLTSAFG
jgi:hypothetical protein